MVHKPTGKGTFRLRVIAAKGREAILSTGCRTEEDALDVEAAYDLWRGAKGKKHARQDVLDALVAKQITLPQAYEAHCNGTLNALMASLQPAVPDVDLREHLTAFGEWKRKQKKGAGQADDYLRMVRVLYPADKPMPLRLFTRREVAARLDVLEVDAPTKNRYKTGISQFAKYLVRIDVLETNFVRDIDGFGENPEREVHYIRTDAQRLIAGMPQPEAGVAAAMAGFCMEWVAIERALVSDFQLDGDVPKAIVRGTKRSWRHREVPLVEPNRWVLPYLRAALSGKMPTAKAFAGLTEWGVLRVQQSVAQELKIAGVNEDRFSQHTLHDWRHTHTVQLIRDGYEDAIAALHLGHKDTYLVHKRYGKYRPTAQDYARKRGRS